MNAARRRQRGQVLPIIALAAMVITAFTGLTVDLGHQFVVKRQLQAAADAAALAGATVLGGGAPKLMSSTPTTYNNAAVVAAHDYAASDGFVTTMPSSQGGSSANNYSPDCYTGGGAGNFREMFFDSSYGTSCASGLPSTGFTTAVQVNIPPQTIAGFPAVPTQCTLGSGDPYNCVQVVITTRVTNYIMGVFGAPNEYLEAVATGLANPHSIYVPLPQSYAAYLYEPATGCTGQCYTPTSALSKGALSCTNCPTMWAQNVGGQININGYNGAGLTPATHFPAVVSAGHMVNQENNLILCDTYGGVVCTNNSAAAGTTGYALGPSANFYCGGANPPSNAVCTNTTPPGALQKVTGNSTTYAGQNFTLQAPTTPSNDCGGLVLNGDPITSTNSPPVFFNSNGTAMASAPAGCYPSSSEPYTIEPGKYNYIVINHGAYEFEGGLYYVYGTAPVNTATVSGTVEANGIDHSQETTGINSDWDLCQTATNNAAGTKACPTLTAGVWIGHGLNCGGGNKCGALVNSTGTTCANGTIVGGTTGGGGDKTDISGSGVSFYFTAASAGLVSTREVDSIVLAGPNLGAMASVNNEPVLINMQSPTAWSHLDGNSGQNVQFTGMVYQTPTATAGGVDIDPNAGNHMATDQATLIGQVLAYSLDFFGQGNSGNGAAIDFTYGYGSSSTTPTGAGNNETSLITIPSNALTSAGSGQETLTVDYTDEWMLDAYDISIQVNSLTTYYFSRPLWTTPPNAYNSGTYSGSLPPQNGYTPSDANPEYMASGQGSPYYTPPSPYVAGTGTHEYLLHTDSGQSDDTVWDISGDWNWGNESNLTGSKSASYAAVVAYTFPVPSGTTVNIQMHVVDGDHCGDYDNVSVTLANVASGSGGVTGVGGTVLVQ